MTKRDRPIDQTDIITVSRSKLRDAIVSQLMAYFSDPRASGVVFLEHEDRYIVGGIFGLVFSQYSAEVADEDSQ